MSLEEYDCPQCLYIKEGEICNYCNNHKKKLIVNEGENNEAHFQLSRNKCAKCKGVGHKKIVNYYTRTRFGQKRRVKEIIEIPCTNCYEGWLVNIITFYKCNHTECEDGDVPLWKDIKLKWYDIFLWYGFMFEDIVQEQCWTPCPTCIGTAKLEKYDFYPNFREMIDEEEES